MDKQAEIERIKQKYAERNKEIERQHRKEMARIIGGGVLQGASALPIFNIPYVGTGIGGALFEAGGSIMKGKNAKDIAKDAGKGFIIGETVGAVPYVGKVAGKTKAGQAAVNKAGNFANRLAETKIGQKVAEIAPKVEDVLMTDIKAFNPFKQTQTAYHGSPYDFAKFSNEAIGTGEGAQAHGMGHYAALNKDVGDRYRENLTTKATIGDAENPRNKYINLEFTIKDLEEKKKRGINNPIIDETLNEAKLKMAELQNKYKPEQYLKGSEGQLYKLSIPKDDVMLREGATFAEQPVKVQNILKREYFDKINANLPLKHQKTPEKILETIGDNDLFRFIKNQTRIEDSLELNNLLNKQGIKGISYNGGIDGEARVIFNPNDIDIVRKYYNQPQALEYFQKFQPNLGAIANSLEQTPVNTKEWKQYAKNNLIGRSVDVPGYTTVNFTNKNLGKDYPYNMPEYPTLAERLMGSEYAFTTNYKNEKDRFYDHLVNTKDDNLFDYLIEVIEDPQGNIHHNYKMMKNIKRGDKP